MVFKTIISFICGLYRFYPVLPMGKTDCFTQFYPILPNWFYPLGKTTLPTLILSPAGYTVLAYVWSGVDMECDARAQHRADPCCQGRLDVLVVVVIDL